MGARVKPGFTLSFKKMLRNRSFRPREGRKPSPHPLMRGAIGFEDFAQSFYRNLLIKIMVTSINERES